TDDDARRVDRSVAREIFQNERCIDEFARGFFTLERQLEFRRDLERLFEGHLQLVRNHFGEAIALTVAQTHHATHVADDRFRAHGAERNDLSNGVAAVFSAQVFYDVGPGV